MAAKDKFHESVRYALEKDGWTVTDDPLKLEFGGTKFEIDLGAERLLVAERDEEQIAVEVKTFLNDSPLTDYHNALGQFLNYRLALSQEEPNRVLYLAVPATAYQSFFQREFAQVSLQAYQVNVIVYDPIDEVIVQWIR